MDPELSFSENFYMTLQTVNDFLLVPAHDAWTLDDIRSAREHMNSVLSTALMKEKQPIFFKFTWRLRAQPLDNTFFSTPPPLCTLNQTRPFEKATAKAVSSFEKDAAGALPSSLRSQSPRNDHRTTIHSSAFSCSSLHIASSNGDERGIFSYPSPPASHEDASCFSESDTASTGKGMKSRAASLSSQFPFSVNKEVADREDGTPSTSLCDGPMERIAIAMYSGDYELLPPSDEDSVYFLNIPAVVSGSQPQQKQQDSRMQQPQQKGKNKPQQLHEEETHSGKRALHPPSDESVSERRREHSQTVVTRQQRASSSLHRDLQLPHERQTGTKFFLTFAELSYIAKWVQRLLSAAGRRFFGASQATERKLKRQRLFPPFPGRRHPNQEEEESAQQRRKLKSTRRAGSLESEGEDSEVEEREGERWKKKEEQDNSPFREGADEGYVYEKEDKLREKNKEVDEGVSSKGQKRSVTKEKECDSSEKSKEGKTLQKKKKIWNIFTPLAGNEQTHPPHFHITLYWPAAAYEKKRVRDRPEERNSQMDTANDKERLDLGQRRKNTATGVIEDYLSKADSEEEGEEVNLARERLYKAKRLEETVQYLQQLKASFSLCSAGKVEAAHRGKSLACSDRDYKIERRQKQLRKAGIRKQPQQELEVGEEEVQNRVNKKIGRQISAATGSGQQMADAIELMERGNEREEEETREREEKKFSHKGPFSQGIEKDSDKAKTCDVNNGSDIEIEYQNRKEGYAMKHNTHCPERKQTKEMEGSRRENRLSKTEKEIPLLRNVGEREIREEGEKDSTRGEQDSKEREKESGIANVVDWIDLSCREENSVDEERTKELLQELESAAFEYLSPELLEALELREKKQAQQQERKMLFQKMKAFYSAPSAVDICQQEEFEQDGPEGRAEEEREQVKVNV